MVGDYVRGFRRPRRTSRILLRRGGQRSCCYGAFLRTRGSARRRTPSLATSRCIRCLSEWASARPRAFAADCGAVSRSGISPIRGAVSKNTPIPKLRERTSRRRTAGCSGAVRGDALYATGMPSLRKKLRRLWRSIVARIRRFPAAEVNIEGDAVLEERYGWDIPVIFIGVSAKLPSIVWTWSNSGVSLSKQNDEKVQIPPHRGWSRSPSCCDSDRVRNPQAQFRADKSHDQQAREI